MSISFKPAQVIAGTANQDAEPPQITASGSTVFVLWHEFPTPASADPDIYLARSTDRGSTFAGRVNLSNTPNVDSRDEDMAVSGDHLFVAWSEGVTDILFRRSTNAGGAFSGTRTLNTTPGAVRPQIKVNGDDVFVVWEAPGPGGNTEIFLAHSGDRGRNFGSETNVSNTPGASEAPQLTVSGDRVIVTWRDDSQPGQGFEILAVQGK